MKAKIFISLAFVAAATFAHSNRVSLRERSVSTYDYKSLPVERIRVFDNLHIDGKDYKVCETEDCQKVAEEILGSMNKSIDPCEDFYEFSCGGWAAYKPVPPTSMSSSRHSLYKNVIYQRIREILGTKPDPSDIPPVVQARRWYRSCMDTESLDRRGIEPIVSIVGQAGGWPLAMNKNDWDSEEFTWQNVERYYARLTGYNAFYDVIATSTHRFGEIGIGPSELFISRYRLMSDSESYENLIKKVANLFATYSGVVISEETLTNDVEALVAFENATLELIRKSEWSENTEWYPANMTVGEFVEWYESNVTKFKEHPVSRIDWNSSIQDLFDTVNVTVRPSSNIFVRNMGYFKEIGDILERTPARTIVSYVHWNFIATMLSHTTEYMRDEIFKLRPEHREFGVLERSPRWLECVNGMKIKYATSYLFADKHFPESTETAVLDMITSIKNGMNVNIEESNWLDADSKILVKDKLNSMKLITGFPSWYKNETAIINYYKGLSIGDRYFENTLGYTSFERKNKLKRYAMSFHDEYMIHDPITLDAEYNTERNALNIPPVNFQSPLFTPGMPDNVNYGMAGFFVGHEMGHGFDDTGMQHGRDGHRTRLSKDTMTSFKQRANCFVDQFDGYYGETKAPENEGPTSKRDVPGESRGSKTRSENIADTSGLQAVFEAYKNLKKSSSGRRLPGLEEFTDEQLFFVSFATGWCTTVTPSYEKELERDEHSPWRLRVIGAVSNSDDFAKVFDCPLGSSMNPSEKCNIWKKPDAATTVTPARIRRVVFRQYNQTAMTELFQTIGRWFGQQKFFFL